MKILINQRTIKGQTDITLSEHVGGQDGQGGDFVSRV